MHCYKQDWLLDVQNFVAHFHDLDSKVYIICKNGLRDSVVVDVLAKNSKFCLQNRVSCGI